MLGDRTSVIPYEDLVSSSMFSDGLSVPFMRFDAYDLFAFLGLCHLDPPYSAH